MTRNLWADEKLITARTYFIDACIVSQRYDATLRAALDTYGDHGPDVSGAGRDHFPKHVKRELRRLAYWVTENSRAGHAARPARYHAHTMRRLASECADRYGSGYYGPQPSRR